jgi:surfeit locus 1 family protein
MPMPRPFLAAGPISGTTVHTLANNHLSYALTWFGLALALFGVFAAFACQTR